MRDSGQCFFFDTVTLSNFALAGRFDLLVSRYGKRAVLTPEVLNEVTDGGIAGYWGLGVVEKAVEDGIVSLSNSLASAAERRTYRELLRVLGSGEASCIAHASAHGGIVVTDDRAARQCCGDRTIPSTGTIGILKACCLDATLTADEADDILAAMIDAGFYSPVQRVSDLI